MRWLLVALLCLSLGLQWAFLQGVAWTGMVISYARDGSVIEAVTKTFDGEHPCPLCKVVEEGQKQDQEKTLDGKIKKLEAALLVALASLVPPPAQPVARVMSQQKAERLAASPPKGPPRETGSPA